MHTYNKASQSCQFGNATADMEPDPAGDVVFVNYDIVGMEPLYLTEHFTSSEPENLRIDIS